MSPRAAWRLESLGDVRERARSAGWDACVVVNEASVVLGLLRSEELARDPEPSIEQAMRPGPSTFRPHLLPQPHAHGG